MKTWAKVGLGCLVILLLCCVIAIVVSFYTGGKLMSLFGGIGGAKQMAQDVKALEKFDKENPFTPPESGDVDEARLQAYIAAATKVKTAMAPFDSWIKEHKGKHEKGDWKDVKDALTMTATLMKSMREGFEEAKMSSTEFHWIEAQMRAASRETGGAGPTDAQKKMVDDSVLVLEEQMSLPSTTPDAKTQLQAQIDKLKATLTEAGGPVSHNRALYLKYQTELQACDLQEFSDIRVN